MLLRKKVTLKSLFPSKHVHNLCATFFLIPAEAGAAEEPLSQSGETTTNTDYLKFEHRKKEKYLKQQLETGKQKFNVNPDMVCAAIST